MDLAKVSSVLPQLASQYKHLVSDTSNSLSFKPRDLHCCNISVGIALNVRFATNGMCAKNNIQIYVAQTSNNRAI